MATAGDRDPARVLVRTLGAILEHACTLPSRHPDAWLGTFDASIDTDMAAAPHHFPIADPWMRKQVRYVDVLRRGDLAWGDTVFVVTKNSTYCINPAGRAWFVWGGWFERQGYVPAVVGINGCTWGGSVIHSDVLAAPGLFLEFANGVTTTRIRSVILVPAGCGAGFCS